MQNPWGNFEKTSLWKDNDNYKSTYQGYLQAVENAVNVVEQNDSRTLVLSKLYFDFNLINKDRFDKLILKILQKNKCIRVIKIEIFSEEPLSKYFKFRINHFIQQLKIKCLTFYINNFDGYVYDLLRISFNNKTLNLTLDYSHNSKLSFCKFIDTTPEKLTGESFRSIIVKKVFSQEEVNYIADNLLALKAETIGFIDKKHLLNTKLDASSIFKHLRESNITEILLDGFKANLNNVVQSLDGLSSLSLNNCDLSQHYNINHIMIMLQNPTLINISLVNSIENLIKDIDILKIFNILYMNLYSTYNASFYKNLLLFNGKIDYKFLDEIFKERIRDNFYNTVDEHTLNIPNLFVDYNLTISQNIKRLFNISHNLMALHLITASVQSLKNKFFGEEEFNFTKNMNSIIQPVMPYILSNYKIMWNTAGFLESDLRLENRFLIISRLINYYILHPISNVYSYDFYKQMLPIIRHMFVKEHRIIIIQALKTNQDKRSKEELLLTINLFMHYIGQHLIDEDKLHIKNLKHFYPLEYTNDTQLIENSVKNWFLFKIQNSNIEASDAKRNKIIDIFIASLNGIHANNFRVYLTIVELIFSKLNQISYEYVKSISNLAKSSDELVTGLLFGFIVGLNAKKSFSWFKDFNYVNKCILGNAIYALANNQELPNEIKILIIDKIAAVDVTPIKKSLLIYISYASTKELTKLTESPASALLDAASVALQDFKQVFDLSDEDTKSIMNKIIEFNSYNYIIDARQKFVEYICNDKSSSIIFKNKVLTLLNTYLNSITNDTFSKNPLNPNYEFYQMNYPDELTFQENEIIVKVKHTLSTPTSIIKKYLTKNDISKLDADNLYITCTRDPHKILDAYEDDFHNISFLSYSKAYTGFELLLNNLHSKILIIHEGKKLKTRAIILLSKELDDNNCVLIESIDVYDRNFDLYKNLTLSFAEGIANQMRLKLLCKNDIHNNNDDIFIPTMIAEPRMYEKPKIESSYIEVEAQEMKLTL